MRHGIARLVAAACRLVQRSPAGIGHIQHPCNLVKALPCCVVARAAENLHLAVVLDIDQHRMSARDDEAQKGRLQIGISDVIRGDMPADMVDGNERFVQCQRRRLRKIHADEQRADQPRRIGHRKRVDLTAGDLCLRKRLLRKSVNRLNVLSRRDLRHNTAVNAVQRHLRGDAVRQHLTPVAHKGDRRLVAGGFN